jgi:hypothetical protein
VSSLQVNYKAEHTAQKFHACDDFVRGLMGPVGSGKSVACTIEILQRMMTQNPSPDGVRRSRWAIIRNTYGELRTTTLNTFKDWIPGAVCKINMQPPITARIAISLPDGTTVQGECLFLALDRADDAKKLLSLELTGAWLNEAREIPKAVLDMATTRVGRYPSKAQGGSKWTGIIMDTNPPDDDHWWYKMAEIDRPKGYRFWRQPPAMIKVAQGKDIFYRPNPDAENVSNLDGGYAYYERIVPGKSHEYIKVMVLGEYGTVYDGRPVYPEWIDSLHCADEAFDPMRGRAIILGWDFGLTPSCIFTQQTPRGQIRIVDELYVEDMGLRQFINEMVKPKLIEDFQGMTAISYADPAGVQRAQTDQRSCFDIMNEEGLPVEPAPSNSPEARIGAVSFFLQRLADGEPGFLLSPRCSILRKGFNGGYRHDRVQMSGSEERYKDQPVKNKFSHPHDALQYAVLSIKELGGTAAGVRGRRKQVNVPSASGWT